MDTQSDTARCESNRPDNGFETLADVLARLLRRLRGTYVDNSDVAATADPAVDSDPDGRGVEVPRRTPSE